MGQVTRFKLDTGAEVTAVSEETFKNISKTTKLIPPGKVLNGPSGSTLQVSGEFEGTIQYRDRQSKQTVYVVRNLKTNLLGLPAITDLNLAVRMDGISTTQDILEKYSSLFQGLGNLGEPYQIKLKEDAKPYALFTARNVPLPLRTPVQEELNRMEKLGVISKVEEPTQWCAGMVVVPKKNKKLRICVDLRPLNESVQREVFPLPKVDETLAQLTGAKIFSKLDANSGFWQIPLSAESRHLTTFITPFGRYCFNKLPFGITSAPEHFQKRMERVLSGIDGVLCLIDDVLVFGRDQEEHDQRLSAVLEKIQAAGVTLNHEKCEFNKTQLLFLSHLINEKGIQADPEKTNAICNMSPPENVSELRRFMGMVNQLGKFTSELADLSQPLRKLLSKGATWQWDKSQEKAYAKIKEKLSEPTILTLYDPKAATKISADTSSFGLGAVLLQKDESSWKPVAYASRSLTETEKRYAQIEKEALAITWACEKFSNYILGKKIQLETDHKPLVPLLGAKDLHSLPPRVLRFRLRLNRFHYEIAYVPGKLLTTADTLSRSICEKEQEISFVEEVEEMMDACVQQLPASKDQLDKYRKAQADDPNCSAIIQCCKQGWPHKNKLCTTLKPYWKDRVRFTLNKELLLYGARIVIPQALQAETLKKVHQGHQGIQRCRLRAKTSIWWLSMPQQIKDLVEGCKICTKYAPPKWEPLMSTPLPEHPW